MANRRRLGIVMLVLGLALAGAGLAGLALDGRGSTVPSADASPEPGGEATTTPGASLVPSATPTSLPTPGPTPTPDRDTLVAGFLAELVSAIRAGTVAAMGDDLHPAVVDRYGAPACAAELASRAADPSFAIEVASVAAPGPWEYATDGISTTIEEVVTVAARVTTASGPAERELHLAIVEGSVRWFTDCGTPQGASPSP